ncbi:MAG: hypothetical protein GY942_13840, partial [Aestuariibacter sp.]|nr:hypothetical protein [Aestuariibacter sp.]
CFRRTCLALAISQTLTLPINAATIEVEVTGDSSASDSNCTLREAVVTVNTGTDTSNMENTAGCFVNGTLGPTDTITFNNTLLGSTITLAQAVDLQINNSNVDLTIDGLGQDSLTIDGGGNSRVFFISSSTVSINNLTISGGSSSGNGGGIYANSSSNVSLANSTVSNNSANYGGGITTDNSSNVSLANSTVSNNSANYEGGGIYAYSSNVSLANSTVSNNSANWGGGISASYSSSVSLANSTVSNNSGSSRGGGIYVNSSNVSLANSIISGNTAGTGAEIHSGGIGSTLTAAKNNLFGHSSLTLAQAFKNFTPGITDINATSGGDNIALSSILSPLAVNGCQQVAGAPSTAACVQTHALVSGSPAMDGADEAVCAGTDQRGKPRKDGMMMPITPTTGNIAVATLR